MESPYYCKDEKSLDILAKENDLSNCMIFGKRPVKEYDEEGEDLSETPNR
jgi:hypothetical protein